MSLVCATCPDCGHHRRASGHCYDLSIWRPWYEFGCTRLCAALYRYKGGMLDQLLFVTFGAFCNFPRPLCGIVSLYLDVIVPSTGNKLILESSDDIIWWLCQSSATPNRVYVEFLQDCTCMACDRARLEWNARYPFDRFSQNIRLIDLPFDTYRYALLHPHSISK